MRARTKAVFVVICVL